jgi:hypothetical protein
VRITTALALLFVAACHAQEARPPAEEVIDVHPALADASVSAAPTAPADAASREASAQLDAPRDASPPDAQGTTSAAAVDASTPTTASTRKSMPPGMRGSNVPCKTDDDCWSKGAEPIARPKRLRGKTFKPCVDGEHAPMCGGDGTCMTMGYRC